MLPTRRSLAAPLVGLLSMTLLVALVVACGEDDHREERDVRINVGVAKLTEQEAISIAQSFASSPGRTVAVQERYTTSRQERVRCSDADVEFDRSAHPNNPELWRCKPSPGGGYYKTTTRTVSECCRTRQVRMPEGAAWSAVYRETEGSWRVEATFDLGDTPQSAIWTVDDESREVTPG